MQGVAQRLQPDADFCLPMGRVRCWLGLILLWGRRWKRGSRKISRGAWGGTASCLGAVLGCSGFVT